jgi:hypothetical protein
MYLNSCRLTITGLGLMALLTLAAWPETVGFAQTGESIDSLMKQWEKDTRSRIEKSPKLKALAAKHELVILHSRTLYAKDTYGRSAYSFVHETSDVEVHRNQVHLLFHNGAQALSMDCNMVVGQQNLLVHLGEADFSKNPDMSKITVEQSRIHVGSTPMYENHVYLERIYDDRGNKFFVMIQIVALDKESRYIAFLWRKLPNGIVVKQ